ncbi:MAG: DivIVA domain-containing protein, partial [Oscillospiraceae bacterium]|nr:DivIVA domain-containing protein [Oscillospiraceae bacterium]
MMTPQEVASHAFAKATLGGYNLAQVDEFLDALTEDYSALYNENAILKNKLKVLSETVEEYRATDNAMRKTLLAAQQMADAMVTEAKQKQSELVSEAEKGAQQRVTELQKSIAAEEYRLKKAQESTAAYVRRLA